MKENYKNYKPTGSFKDIKVLIYKLMDNLKNLPKAGKMDKNGKLALILTIVIMIILGVIMWFIPFTNGFIRELTVDNPLFSWIGKL